MLRRLGLFAGMCLCSMLHLTLASAASPPALTLTLLQTTVLEGRSVKARITRNSSTAAPLAVTLSSSDTNEARIPARAVIPAGQSQVYVAVEGVWEALVDGTQTAVLQAAAPGYASARATLTVTDRDRPQFQVHSLQFFAIKEGPTGAPGTYADLTVISNVVNSRTPQVFRINATPAGQIRVPDSVTIPAGANKVAFRVSAIDDDVFESTRLIKLNISSPGYTTLDIPIFLKDNEWKASIRGRVTLSPDLANSNRPIGVPRTYLVLQLEGKDVDSALTDAAGYYSFDNLRPGNYVVKILTPNQPDTSQPASREVNVAESQIVTGQDFTVEIATAIRGTVSTYLENGTAQPTQGVTVQARSGNRTYTANTNAEGNYLFTGIPLGVYTVQPVQPGFISKPNSNVLKLTVEASQVNDRNFYLRRSANNSVATASSSSALSTLSATAGSIRLAFFTPIDEQSALNAAAYHVVVNGIPLTVEHVQINGNVVTLTVPEAALAADSLVTVSWNGLHDQQGHSLQGQQSSQVR